MKNIGVLAHVDAGKTTVTEQFLYQSGAIPTPGRVDRGDTVTDSMALERQRGITIRASTISFTWKGVKINLLDTPGHMDFIAEVERSFAMLDGAVLVLSAREGVQRQTRVIFRMLQRAQVPTLLFVNKIDRLGADPQDTLAQAKALLSERVVALQQLEMDGGPAHLCPLPLDAPDTLEQLLDVDASLAEAFLSGGEISAQRCASALQTAAQRGMVYPVLFGAALKGWGIPELMDALITYLPDALDRSGEEVAACVYKVEHEGGRRVYLKLHAGEIRLRQSLPWVGHPGQSIKVKALSALKDGRRIPVERMPCGDIAILEHEPELKVGDRLGREEAASSWTPQLQATLQASVSPVNPKERSALISALLELNDEDPLLRCAIDPDTQQITLQLFGKVQLEVLQALLEQRYTLSACFGGLMTVYRERPVQAAEAYVPIGKRPNPYYAIGLRVQPLPLGSGVQVESQVSYGYLTVYFKRRYVKAWKWAAGRESLAGRSPMCAWFLRRRFLTAS